jgi:hypothetical protein
MKFALVKNNVCVNVIIASQDFINAHPELYDVAYLCIGDTYGPTNPQIDDVYDPGSQTFSPAS